MNIGDNDIHASSHDAQRTARKHSTFKVKTTHEHIYAFAQPAKYPVCGHDAIFKDQLTGVRATHAELIEFLRHAKTRRVLVDQKSGDATRTCFDIIFCIDHNHIGIGSVSNPHFAPIEHPVITAKIGPGFHRHDIRACIGLTHGKRPNPFT